MQPNRPGRGSARSRRCFQVLPAIAFAALLLVPGCGGSGGSPAVTQAGLGPKVTVMARSVPGVGQVLVTSTGYTLYLFQPDDRQTVTCTAVCAGTWPPLMLPSGGVAVAGPGVKSSLLGSDPDPAGGRVVTYDGWPLYTYVGDIQPRQATGQGIDLNGGAWFVLRPSGAPLIPAQ